MNRNDRKMVRLVTCGNVDDGKSTLIGRLLWETEQITLDQLEALQRDSLRYGTQGESLEYALLLDGLMAEREQGITIDIAYRTLITPNVRYLLADSPGHEQYTRNMFTAASEADIAIVLVDSSKAMAEQTYRHLRLLAMLKVSHVVVTLNKMDQVAYAETVFKTLKAKIDQLNQVLGIQTVSTIPVSALHGDNVRTRSQQMPWYTGKTLFEEITQRSAEAEHASVPLPATFAVQWVQRNSESFRGYAGTIATGTLKQGQKLRVAAKQQTVTIKNIAYSGEFVTVAKAGQAVMLELNENIELSRGSFLCEQEDDVCQGNLVTAKLLWMSAQEGRMGQRVLLQIAGRTQRVRIEKIVHTLELETGQERAATQLSMNHLYQVHLQSSEPILWYPYAKSKKLGSGILVDFHTNETLGAVILDTALPSYGKQDISETRLRLYGHRPGVVWLTGLPAAGKTTLAQMIEEKMLQAQYHCVLIDADIVRQSISSDLGFSAADRQENVRRIGELAQVLMQSGVIVVVACIAPFAVDRERIKAKVGFESFLEIWVDTPLDICEKRDPKGLYRKAREGIIQDMTGVDSPYERPINPDMIVQNSYAEIEKVWNRIRNKFAL